MITVIGSINMDFIIQLTTFPQQGETVIGRSLQTMPGGKGANQAIAIARLGSDVTMVGCVGSDDLGRALKTQLQQEHVKSDYVTTVTGATGIANILLHDEDNRIIVVPGANEALQPAQLMAVKEVIQRSQLVVMQLEIPQQTVSYALQLCKEASVPVLLNPAPATNFDPQWLEDITYLTPNQTEFEQLFEGDLESVLAHYPNQLIVTLGNEGACYFDGAHLIHIPAYMTPVVDTTGAGDTFNGALAYALVVGQTLEEAVYFANVAASLAIGEVGAQTGMPSAKMVYARMMGLEDEFGIINDD
ncbi:ribokinase [Lysinibacillus piscis]|uniref:Ribokinase n=1 Tax=Lysinibacillus piscis TaxID=2518931 RepID=A0ABQ5NLG3_9BACI|nr:ribokinase [Lysinibacillus sp. KH24]GLC89202.1 ribokinase [Lysinibacillus sp. KH24]